MIAQLPDHVGKVEHVGNNAQWWQDKPFEWEADCWRQQGLGYHYRATGTTGGSMTVNGDTIVLNLEYGVDVQYIEWTS